MSRLDAHQLRSTELLEGDAVWMAIGLLAAALELSDGDSPTDLARERLDAIVGTTPDRKAAALLDWWLVTRLGRRSHGRAYELPDVVDASLSEVMTAVLEQSRSDGTASIPGIRARRELAALLEEFARELHHQQGKVGAQGVTWDDVEAIYRPVLEALTGGGAPALPSTTITDVRAMMRDHEVRRGSDIWRKLERDWQRLDEICADACRLAADPSAGYTGPVPLRIELDLDLPSSTADRVGRLLLADLVQPSEAPREVFDLVLSELAAADAADREWLAVLTFPVCEAQRLTPPLVAADHQRIRRCEKELARLERSGVDVDLARLTLWDGAISEAEAEVEAARVVRANADRTRNLREEHRELVSLAMEADADDDVIAELELAGADIEDGALEQAAVKIRQLREDLSAQIEENRAARARALVAEIGRLGVQLEDSMAARATVGDVDDDDIRLLQDAYDQAEVTLKLRIEERLGAGARRLANERQLLDEPVVRSIDQLLGSARSSVSENDLPAADEKSRRAMVLLDQALPRAWRHDGPESEVVLVEHLKNYITDRLGFSEADVSRLYVSLKTKRFAVLAGLTGSGKTTIARLFAEALGATSANDRFIRIAVRPNWVDEAEVLGYVNPISRRFEPGWFATVIRLCERTPDLPVFCLLDEMNLAPVEFYLADYLSALEEAAGGADTKISLYSMGASVENADEWPCALVFPDNLFMIGTVNIDESTRALSDRVLDRGNVIQLAASVNDRHHHTIRDGDMEPRWQVRMRDWRAACAPAPSAAVHQFLVDVGEVLTDRLRLGMGVRAHVEIERFVANSSGVLDAQDALDFAILQRVLPKIRGFKRDLESGLEDLHDLFASQSLDRSLRVLESWLDERLSADDYVDGSHASVGLTSGR